MEKIEISTYQLFVLVSLFEMGSALVVGIGASANQDAWLAILLGLSGGLLLFIVYHQLYVFYPTLPLTSYVQKITGKFIGRILAFLYIIYFIYIAARVLRDFGELLVTSTYERTPMFVISTLMMITIFYAVYKGFEVIARVGELYFLLVYFLAIAGFILIIVSGLIHMSNLLPMLENGLKPVVKTTLTQTLTFPFGEMVVFSMFYPYLNDSKKVRKVGMAAMVLSGINLAITMAINIAVLGTDIVSRSPFPLLSTISKIEIAEFIEHLDVLFMLYLVIGGFFKVTIFFYAATLGISNLFGIKDQRQVCLPMGLIILFISMTIAPNYAEHIQEGIKVVPIYIHWPMQIIIPITLLLIALLKRRKKSTVSKNVEQ